MRRLTPTAAAISSTVVSSYPWRAKRSSAARATSRREVLGRRPRAAAGGPPVSPRRRCGHQASILASSAINWNHRPPAGFGRPITGGSMTVTTERRDPSADPPSARTPTGVRHPTTAGRRPPRPVRDLVERTCWSRTCPSTACAASTSRRRPADTDQPTPRPADTPMPPTPPGAVTALRPVAARGPSIPRSRCGPRPSAPWPTTSAPAGSPSSRAGPSWPWSNHSADQPSGRVACLAAGVGTEPSSRPTNGPWPPWPSSGMICPRDTP